MSVIPGDVDADRGPPTAIPLRHFVVGLALLVLGAVAGLVTALRGGAASLVHVHLLLAGWVCVTIAGAMTQFVPVWSGVALFSRRLARWQLRLLTAGLLWFAMALSLGRWQLVAGGAVLMLAGFWTFVGNMGLTLRRARPLDVTERHFAAALACFLAVTTLGLGLAVDFAWPFLADAGLAHGRVRAAHATLAVFGAVLLTVVGALYQLATMFTQTDLDRLDSALQRSETAAFPVGVVALAGGRLAASRPLALVGGVLVAGSLLVVSVVVGRRLVETRVERTPMLSRYLVVVLALVGWVGWTLPAWLRDPLAPAALLGPPGASHLLVVGVVGFVVAGTLYHVVPFLLWVHRYADRLGYEDVPMIDDLYRDDLAAADFWLLLSGAGTLTAGLALDGLRLLVVAGGILVLVGACLFVANLVLTIREHGTGRLLGTATGPAGSEPTDRHHEKPVDDG